ncbi:hypothetical protein BDY24DRAFT_383545 [Mrakia frigida]|uniref:uncharacterized protein n=1 Tax=Mrakia frigida TaxID=29902 RepID=UPI003FCC1EFD
MSNSYDPYSSYPSSSKDTSGADHDFDFDHLLNLPPFSPPSSAESPLVSSPENSNHSRHYSPDYDLNSISGGEERTSPAEAAMSWEGILRGPIWPDTNTNEGGEFSSNSLSTSSTTSFSPQTPLNHHLPSPSPLAAAPPPSTLPSFFFPSSDPNPAPTPAPQPSSALLDALMTYNARYGTILPPSNNASSSSIPAESSTTAASARGDDEHDEEEEEAPFSAGGGAGDLEEEEDEDSVAYRDMFGTTYQATGGEAGPSSYLGVGGSSAGPRRTMGGQVMSSVVVEEGEERVSTVSHLARRS